MECDAHTVIILIELVEKNFQENNAFFPFDGLVL